MFDVTRTGMMNAASNHRVLWKCMAHYLLSKWLELPPNPWPPSHYALLGLEPGTGTADEIEQRVLERMEGLRHYQLMQPDAVTEGMNLLAQAMISLTDPDARRQYDAELGVESKAESRTEPADEKAEDEAEEEEAEELHRPLPTSEPLPLPVEDAGPLSEPIEILELDDEREEAVREDEDDESLEIPRTIYEREKPEVSETPRSKRRRIYREIVQLRRVMEAWARLEPFLDKPAKTFSRRTDTVAFMNCLADLRPLLGNVDVMIGSPNEPGHLIFTLAKQQLVVEMFRSFLPSQHDALTRDFRAAYAIMRDHYRTLRMKVRRLTAKSFGRRVIHPIYRHLGARPEWLFLALGLIALVVAFIRSVPN